MEPRHGPLQNKQNVTVIIQQATQQKWDFAGHVAKTKDNRWNRRIIQWRPWTGGKSKGGHRHRTGCRTEVDRISTEQEELDCAKEVDSRELAKIPQCRERKQWSGFKIA